METLPIEMVEKIVQQLTPQDLARCYAVCRKWREIFNQDWMWKPHCDPELEEPLRTIPCVATPAFADPEAENSTLSPISRWKLAFMREKHLWKNWKCKETIENKKENVIDSKNKNQVVVNPFAVDFITDTLVVAWYSNYIQILDVSAMPAALVAETDASVEIFEWDECSVIGTTILLVETLCSFVVFSVDIMGKSIKLEHTTFLDQAKSCFVIRIAIEHFYLCVNIERTKLVIFDLNTGKTLKEEPCPVVVNQNETAQFLQIKCSPTSDFVAVSFKVVIDGDDYCMYYIYNPRQLTFLPDPVSGPWNICNVNLDGDLLAFIDCKTLTVYNIKTCEILLNHEVGHDLMCEDLYVCNGSFIFRAHVENKSWVKSYFPLDRSLATLCEIPDGKRFQIINNKFVGTFGNTSKFFEIVWKLSGQPFETCGITIVPYCCKINPSFTKVLEKEYLFNVSGNVTWYINNLW